MFRSLVPMLTALFFTMAILLFIATILLMAMP